MEYVLASCFDQHTFVTTFQGRFDFSIFEILRVLCLTMRWRRSASPQSAAAQLPSDSPSMSLSLSPPLFFFCHAIGMWDLVFLTRDQTCTPYIESTESQPLGHQGSPSPTSCFHVLLVSMLTCRHKLPAHSLQTVEPQSPPSALGGAHADVGGGERLQIVAPLGQASLSPPPPAPYSIRTLHTEALPFHQM